MARDPVSPETRAEVFERDKRCVLSIFDASHTCYTAWGDEHEPDDLDKCTLEHIKWKLMMGRRGPSEAGSMVTLCGWRNVIRPMSKLERAWTREYLMQFIPREETP